MVFVNNMLHVGTRTVYKHDPFNRLCMSGFSKLFPPAGDPKTTTLVPNKDGSLSILLRLLQDMGYRIIGDKLSKRLTVKYCPILKLKLVQTQDFRE